MFLEADVNQPRTAAEERTEDYTTEEFTNAWLDGVEASVARAHAALLGPRRTDLLQFTSEMQSASRERLGLAVQPAMAPRLAALRKRLTLVRSMLRQAAAFEQAREQLETDGVLGYTPKGLERSL
jgi:hypothetical protein